MDPFDLPPEFDDVEIIYLDDNQMEEIDQNDEMDGEAEGAEEGMEETDMEIPEDLAKTTFADHSKAVFCCSISPDNKLAVTGGEDDKAFVWEIASGRIIFECTGHGDSVTEVGFNHDGRYVVTADMGGLIQVWDIAEKKLKWCNEGDDLEWLSWHDSANVIITGSKSGEVYVWQVPQGNCKVFPSHGAASTCGKLLKDGKRIMVGYDDGMVKLWDIKSTSIVWQLEAPLNSDVTNITINNDNTLFAVAPHGAICKVENGKPIGIFATNDKNDIECILFGNDLPVVVTGTLSGQLCVWDLGTQVLRHEAKLDYSVSILKWASNSRIVVGATSGQVYVCDIRTGKLLENLTGHRDDILSISVSSDSSFVLTTSDDATAKIFTLKNGQDAINEVENTVKTEA